jgi:hypothetical protein
MPVCSELCRSASVVDLVWRSGQDSAVPVKVLFADDQVLALCLGPDGTISHRGIVPRGNSGSWGIQCLSLSAC